MAIAFSQVTTFNAGSGNRNITHNQTGTPQGVLVVMPENAHDLATHISAITYGGVALSEVTQERFAGGESISPAMVVDGLTNGNARAFFCGSGLPSGSVTVAITSDSADQYSGSIFTVTAAEDTSVHTGEKAEQDTGTPSTVSFDITEDCFVAGVIWTSTNTVAGLGGATGTGGSGGTFHTVDFGGECGGEHRLANIQSAGTISWGVSGATPAEHALIAVAIQEGGVEEEPDGWPDAYLGMQAI